MRAKHLMLAAVIVLAMPAGHGAGQEIGQASRGLALAQRLCAECHAVQKEYSQSPNANAPRFQAIASIPGMTATALLAVGHLEKFFSPSRHESDSMIVRGHGRMERAGHGAEGLFRC